MTRPPATEHLEILPGAFHVPSGSGDAPHLIGSRCRRCGLSVFPRMGVCPVCVEEDTMEPAPMGRSGRLFQYTIAHTAIEGFEAPYFQAYVDLPEGPRIFSLISSEVPVRGDALELGMPLELVIEPVRTDAQGRVVLTYKYRPAATRGGDS